MLDLRPDVALCCGGTGTSAAGASENPGSADSQCRAEDWPGEVDPVAREVGADEIGAEGAGRIHRCAGDRATPQAREGDVGADSDRAENADVLRPRCGAENDAHQAEGQDRLLQERVSLREA